MQFVIDVQFISVFVTTTISISVGMYLIHLWYNQNNRLLSDLPFVFGVTFVVHAVNNTIRILPRMGFIDPSLELFKVRSLIILGTVLPIIAALLRIWLPRISKFHSRIIIVLGFYWFFVVLFSSTVEIILLFCVPLVLVSTITLALTFTITWKTGRLKEVRSGLMVISLVLATLGQLMATFLLVNSVFNALSTLLAGIALINPWRRSDIGSHVVTDSDRYEVPQVYGGEM